MLSTREPGSVEPGDHVVQFYERDADLVERVGEYLETALAGGAIAVVIATPEHRAAFTEHLARRGVDASGLLMHDAAATLGRFMPDGSIDRFAFFDTIGGVIREAGAGGRPVCAFGEMVALLWDAGDVLSAIELEGLWNDLALELPFSLYCAYHSDSMAGHEHADALHQVCAMHAAVVPAVDAGQLTADLPLELHAVSQARHLVADVLRDWGFPDAVVADAALVATELATNAILHANTAFTVGAQRFGPAVRISVRDRGAALPALLEPDETRLSGRGMHMIGVLSRRWGVEVDSDGKTVWAELGR